MQESTIAIIILAAIIISFVLEKIPLAMTSILGAIAMAVFGITDFVDVFSGFASNTLMMVVGVMVIGNAIFETGLAKEIGERVFDKLGSSEKTFLLVIMVFTAIISAFFSNTATVAMLMPVIVTAAIKSKGKITKKNTFMALGFASVVGGNCTLIGSTPQLIAQGILEQTEGVRTLGFFELAKGALPIVILLIVYFLTIGYWLGKKTFDFEEKLEVEAVSDNEEKSKNKMWLSGIIALACIVCFVLEIFPVGVTAMIGAVFCIITGCISEKKAYEKMDWSAVVILGGALGFSKGIEVSGAGEKLAQGIIVLLGGESASGWITFAVLVLIAVLLGNVMSHTATVAMLTPICIHIAQTLNLDPITFVIGIVIGANLAFATPVGTTPITMTLAGGYRFKDYVIVGGAFNIIAYLCAIITIPLFYGL